MKTKLSNILIGLQAAAALCVIGAVKVWAPVCGKMLELANGNETHMKCFYSGQAAIAVAVIILAAAIAAFLAKKGHRKILIVSAVAAVMLFLLFGSLIGVCASAEMQCRATALWGKGAAILTFVTSLMELLRSKEGQIPG